MFTTKTLTNSRSYRSSLFTIKSLSIITLTQKLFESRVGVLFTRCFLTQTFNGDRQKWLTLLYINDWRNCTCLKFPH